MFAHLGADVEGVREAVWLAEAAGGVLDHAASGALLRDLDPIRETGGFQTTSLEAAVRADVVLWIGPSDAAPDWLTGSARAREDFDREVIWLEVAGARRLSFLAALRARVKQRPAGGASFAVEKFAATLSGAKFGVAMWSAAALEPLAVEAIHGLVRDLNETTRFSTLATPALDNGLGVQTVCGWMTGFPLRMGFVRGRPIHDPWRYDSARLIASGEADCVIWVSSIEGGAVAPQRVAIALCGAGAPPNADVHFAVARPGVDGDAILYDARVGALVAQKSSAARSGPTVASTLAAIRARLEGPPC